MVQKKKTWRKGRDPLFRGDRRDDPSVPDPGADSSIVRHILYLGGAGRLSPYHSASESPAVARYFAGDEGWVYSTTAARAEALSVTHIGRVQLLGLLIGTRQGSGAVEKRTGGHAGPQVR